MLKNWVFTIASGSELLNLKILYVITKSNWGGAQRYVYDMAVAAKARGSQVLVAAGGEGELITRLTDAGISVRTITGLSRDISVGDELRAFNQLRKLFKEKRPDVVHLNSSKAGLAALAARLSGVKRIVFTVHGWAWNEARPAWQKLIIRCIYWATLVLVDVAIAVSDTTRAQASGLPFVQKKFRVVHNGLSHISFLSRAEARKKLLPGSPRTFWIGTIAELHPVKGLDVLIEAFEHMTVDFPEAELVIIGEGEERGALERQMKIEGVSGRSHLVGQVANASETLSAFDMFVLPSRSEALGYVLLEAGLAGLPVVATNVGGIPEIITDTVTGLLVPPDNRELLTDAMEKLSGDESLRARYGKALQEKVEKEFSREQMVKETFALY